MRKKIKERMRGYIYMRKLKYGMGICDSCYEKTIKLILDKEDKKGLDGAA